MYLHLHREYREFSHHQEDYLQFLLHRQFDYPSLFGDKYDRAVVGGRCAGVRRVPSLRVEESALNFFLGGESMTVEASFTDGLNHRTGCDVNGLPRIRSVIEPAF